MASWRFWLSWNVFTGRMTILLMSTTPGFTTFTIFLTAVNGGEGRRHKSGLLNRRQNTTCGRVREEDTLRNDLEELITVGVDGQDAGKVRILAEHLVRPLREGT